MGTGDDQYDRPIDGAQLASWRREAIAEAIAAGVAPAELDWLLQEFAGLDKLSLRLESFKDLAEIQLGLDFGELKRLWRQRLNGRMPVQYLTGVAPWRHFSLAVSPEVLIPRPETECLIDLAIASISSKRDLTWGNWADLGTGSGAIALGLASVFPDAIIHAVDCSANALKIAEKNAFNSGLAQRIRFYRGSWFEPLGELKGQLSGMVANPPYIPRKMIPQLQPEVTLHEPHLALDGGDDGLDCIRELLAIGPDYLCPGGVWLVEMMASQAPQVREMLENQGSYDQIQIFPDLAGIERFALAYKR
ncbi:MAG: peptide chain release factor N(5)-glutamine methyltransferase [Hormoscilla sp. GM102CHS1]|nr:peptide chain release factor N(5)-glutamine methyltransferase [Hormoscilla sp. GM102CHS1]